MQVIAHLLLLPTPSLSEACGEGSPFGRPTGDALGRAPLYRQTVTDAMATCGECPLEAAHERAMDVW